MIVEFRNHTGYWETFWVTGHVAGSAHYPLLWMKHLILWLPFTLVLLKREPQSLNANEMLMARSMFMTRHYPLHALRPNNK